MSKTKTILAIEVAQPGGTQLDRNVAAYGLDPNLFVGVLPNAHLSRFGVVNRNQRIYPEDIGEAAIKLFDLRVKQETVDGDDGHPSWDKLMTGVFAGSAGAWLSAETYRDEAGVLCAKGAFALFATTAGKDLAVIYEAGVKLGVSSRAMASFTDTYIEDGSPWLNQPENMRYRNRWVDVCTSWSLGLDGTFDIVRTPSAGTFIESAAPQVRDAYERLIQTKTIREESVMSDPVPAAETVTMTRAEQQKLIAEVQANAIQAAATESAKLKEQITAQEAAMGALKAEVASLLATNAANEAKIAAATVAAALDAYIAECATGPHGPLVTSNLKLLRAKDVIRTVDEAKIHVEALTSACETSGLAAPAAPNASTPTTTPAPSVRADEAASTTRPNDPVLAMLSEVL